MYDQTGGLSDQDDFLDAYKKFRKVFSKVEHQDIESYAQKYQGSLEEESDLVEFLILKKGDVKNLLQEIICSKNSDLPRLLSKLEQLITRPDMKIY